MSTIAQDAILTQIMAARPAVHPTREGQSRCIGLHSEVLKFLYQQLSPEQRTLETGCGLSTLIFALAGCQHQSIVPNQEHIDATRKSAEHYQISLDQTSFIVARSEFVLPTLSQTHPLDVVLIDGGHAFPLPFIDWFYTAQHLRVSGLMILDDTHLKTVSILHQFLYQQPGWSEVSHMHQTAFFRKTHDQVTDEWDYWRTQPFNQTWRSRLYQLKTLWRKTVSRQSSEKQL